jgi:hypothetical protein
VLSFRDEVNDLLVSFSYFARHSIDRAKLAVALLIPGVLTGEEPRGVFEPWPSWRCGREADGHLGHVLRDSLRRVTERRDAWDRRQHRRLLDWSLLDCAPVTVAAATHGEYGEDDQRPSSEDDE